MVDPVDNGMTNFRAGEGDEPQSNQDIRQTIFMEYLKNKVIIDSHHKMKAEMNGEDYNPKPNSILQF